MRRSFLFAATVGAAGAASLLGACTFLIPFDEVAQVEAGVVTPAPDAVTSPEAGPDAVVDARSDARPCRDAADGLYCASQPKLAGYEGDRDDLVTCRGREVFAVRYCDSGTGCIRMVDPYPDQCDECRSKADGTYCGRDMAGWNSMNANMRVRCDNGAQVAIVLCANGCQSNGASSACRP